MIPEHSDNVWKQDICFYLDGSSSIHKINPADQARAPMAKVWRIKNKRLKRGGTAKGKKTGSGGKTILWFVFPMVRVFILQNNMKSSLVLILQALLNITFRQSSKVVVMPKAKRGFPIH